MRLVDEELELIRKLTLDRPDFFPEGPHDTPALRRRVVNEWLNPPAGGEAPRLANTNCIIKKRNWLQQQTGKAPSLQNVLCIPWQTVSQLMICFRPRV